MRISYSRRDLKMQNRIAGDPYPVAPTRSALLVNLRLRRGDGWRVSKMQRDGRPVPTETRSEETMYAHSKIRVISTQTIGLDGVEPRYCGTHTHTKDRLGATSASRFLRVYPFNLFLFCRTRTSVRCRCRLK